MKHSNREQGFTLVELSIVIVILGLIVTGITGSKYLVRNAQLQRIMTDLTQYKSAVQSFKTAYKALPGDMRNATTYWPETTNGNGNWVINMENENLYSWEHLDRAGIIPEFEAAWSATDVLLQAATEIFGVPSAFAECTEVTPGDEVPITTGIKKGGYFLTQIPEPIHGKNGNVILIGTLESGVAPSGLRGPIVAPQEAYRIDKKLDDGVANKGNMMGEKGVTSMVECLNASDDYDTRNDAASACYMVFWL